MFSMEDRGAVRRQLIEHARVDKQVTGCALLGSSARKDEDAWSDIDVALQLAEDVVLSDVVSRWSAWMSETFGVADHLDVLAFGALYRVFLLDDTLQVDLSFWPHEQFRSIGGPAELVFGVLTGHEPAAVRDPIQCIRMGWLYALHARSAIARGRSWQAEMMLADLRLQVMTLACLRHDLDPSHGRGADELPDALLAELVSTRPTGLERAEQQRSLRETVDVFRVEITHHDRDIARSLAEPLAALSTSVDMVTD